jgi:tol-pal system protein YbgF
MLKHRHALLAVALGLPLYAVGQVPVVENDQSTYGGSGYSTAAPQTGGAYAGGGAAAPPSGQGMLFIQLQQMQEEIAQLRGMLEVQQNEIQRLQQEGLERYKDLDSRLSSAGSNSSASQNSMPAGATAGGSNTAAPAAPAAQSAASNQPGDPEKEKLYYDAAFDLIKAKDFDKASQAFTAFLRKYPSSPYAGNAQYWLGEVNLAKGDLQGAGQAFAKVSQGYPQHNKVPDSLYKLADVELRLGNRDKAHGILRQVIAQYPNSSAAQLAQRQLNR